MAEFFSDISAVGNEYQAYADTPTSWAVPQDGNGKAGPGHSAAVAISTIDVAGCTASGTGTIGVLGVTVSSTLNASGAALATAIVTAINAATTAVSATYSANLLPLNRLVFARVNPGLNTQVQIMLRIAGTDWNGMAPTQANISPAATIGAFSGGADGPFGYVINSATVFGRAAGDYGTWLAASAGVTTPGSSDVINYRVRRSGADLTLTYSVSASTTKTWRSTNHLYDNGSVWTGDVGGLDVLLRNTAAGTTQLNLQLGASGSVSHGSKEGNRLRVNWACTAAAGTINFATAGSNSAFAFNRCEFNEGGINVGSGRLANDGATLSGVSVDISESKISFNGTVKAAVAVTSANSEVRVKAYNTLYEVVAATGALGTPITASVNSTQRLRFEGLGGAIYDTNGVYTASSLVAVHPDQSNTQVVVDRVSGITGMSLGLTPSAVGASSLFWNQPEGPYRGFRYETAQYVTDWRADGTFPYLSSQSVQGDYWAHRVTWTSAINRMVPAVPLRLALMHRAATAARTLTLELLVPDATTFYTDEVGMVVSYTDASGAQRTENVGAARLAGLTGSRTALSSSSASWTMNGVTGFSAKKIQITTQHSVKQDSEISIFLTLATARSPSIVFYVHPTPGVA